MMAMAKVFLLMLVVFKAAALENSREIDFDRVIFSYCSPSPSPLPDVHQQKEAASPCAAKCESSCKDKKSYQKVRCVANCITKCISGSSPPPPPDVHQQKEAESPYASLSSYSSQMPSPLSHPPSPSAGLAPSTSYSTLSSLDIHEHIQSGSLCDFQCAVLCTRKKSFDKMICLKQCAAKCGGSSSGTDDDINCIADCAQSSMNGLRYDASLIDDRVRSCYQQCKKD